MMGPSQLATLLVALVVVIVLLCLEYATENPLDVERKKGLMLNRTNGSTESEISRDLAALENLIQADSNVVYWRKLTIGAIVVAIVLGCFFGRRVPYFLEFVIATLAVLLVFYAVLLWSNAVHSGLVMTELKIVNDLKIKEVELFLRGGTVAVP